MRILVVEDESKVARALKEGLEGEHYEVVVAKTGEEGFFRANAETYDLVVLDLMLPGRSGLEVLATLRKRGLQTPVLILTARSQLASLPAPPCRERFFWKSVACNQKFGEKVARPSARLSS